MDFKRTREKEGVVSTFFLLFQVVLRFVPVSVGTQNPSLGRPFAPPCGVKSFAFLSGRFSLPLSLLKSVWRLSEAKAG